MGESEAYLLGRESEILSGKEILAQSVKQGSCFGRGRREWVSEHRWETKTFTSKLRIEPRVTF